MRRASVSIVVVVGLAVFGIPATGGPVHALDVCAPVVADAGTFLLDHFEDANLSIATGPNPPGYAGSRPGLGRALDGGSEVWLQYPDWPGTGPIVEGSIEMWLRPPPGGPGFDLISLEWFGNTAGSGHVFASRYRAGESGFPDRAVQVDAWSDGVDPLFTASALPAGEWSHLAVTWGPDGTHIYLNGVLDASDPTGLTIATDIRRKVFLFGAGTWGGPLVDELHLSTVQRSAAEIAAHAACAPAPARVVYVDASATGADDGTSWTDAHPELQSALAGLEGGERIWIAAGTYRPDFDPGSGVHTGATTSHFDLHYIDGVEIYGGFPPGGGGGSFAARDPDAFATVLSGDLAGDDGPGFTNRSDNAEHVVSLYLADGIVLDGMTVRGGNALNSTGYQRGGGVYALEAGLLLRDVEVRDNQASHGGGLAVFHNDSVVTVADSSFVANQATASGGGLNHNSGSLEVTGTTFSANDAPTGGGIWALPGARFADCLLSGNTADDGGGAFLDGASALVSSVLTGNQASRGGGVRVQVGAGQTVELVDLTLAGNHATLDGGGIYAAGTGAMNLAGAVVSGNTAGSGAGAYLTGGLDALVVNGSFTNNAAVSDGDGLWLGVTGAVTVANTILWGNGSAEIHLGGGAAPVVTRSVIAGGFAGGTAVLDADPLYRDPDGADGTVGTVDDDLRVARTSPAVDAGDNGAVPPDTVDLDGDGDLAEPLSRDAAGIERFLDLAAVPDTGAGTAPIVDIGAFETGPRFVDASATGAGDGSSWHNAFTELQAALAVADGTDEIWVAAGTYLPDYDPGSGTHTGDTGTTFAFPAGPPSQTRLYGGFPPGGGARAERAPAVHRSVLSGDLAGDDASGLTADNSVTVVDATSTSPAARLDGFVVTAATEQGIYGAGADLVVANADISDNHGRGIRVVESDLEVRDSTIARNTYNGPGGGMYVSGGTSDLALVGVVVADNTGTNGGGVFGGITTTVVNSVFRGNTGCVACTIGINGGALVVGDALIVNTVFSGNRAYRGSAVRVWFGDVTMVNVTASGNEATAGTIEGSTDSSLTLANSILWSNTESAPVAAMPVTAIAHSLLPGGAAGPGNLDADPGFADADGPDDVFGTADDDLTLGDASPALDAGDNALVLPDGADLDGDGDTLEPVPIDLAGAVRFFDHPAADAGAGTPPLVDLGALERIQHRPVAAADDATVAEDVILLVNPPGVLANDTDADGDSLHTVLETQAAHGTVVLDADGSYRYTPDPDWNGTDSFTYRALDAASPSAPATVTVVVTPVPDAPRAVADAYETDEDEPLTIPAPGVLGNDSDPDGDPITAQWNGWQDHGTVTLNPDGSFTFTPDEHFWGTAQFGYRAADGGGLTSTDVGALITVRSVNDPPVAFDDGPWQVAEGGTLAEDPGRNVLVNDTDVDNFGAALSAVVESPPVHGVLTLHPDGTFRYVHDGSETTADSFTYRMFDTEDYSEPATVTLQITPENDPPVAVPDGPWDVAEGGTLAPDPGRNVLANDTDADHPSAALRAELVAGPAHGALTLEEGGTFSYVHDGSETTADSFTYRVFDGEDHSTPATVALTILPVNEPPEAQPDGPWEVAEGGTLAPDPGRNVLANDTDVDHPSAALRAELVAGPAHGALTLEEGGTFSYAHDGSETTADSFTYRVFDGEDYSTPATVALTILPVNDPPLAVSEGFGANDDAVLIVPAPGVLADDTDPEGAPLTAALVQGPRDAGSDAPTGTLDLRSDGSFTFTPPAGYVGTVYFLYTAFDGEHHSEPARVDITVARIPDADLEVVKTAEPDPVAIGELLRYTIVVTNHGPDPATGVEVTDVLPAAVRFSTASAGCTESAGRVVCALGTLAVGRSVAVQITVTPLTAGSIDNLAVATANEIDPDGFAEGAAAVNGSGPGAPTARVAGLDRIETAIQASHTTYLDGEAGAVVLARSDLFPDALAGAPLAVAHDAPLLLTRSASLDSRTETEIRRVLPAGGTVFVLGGTGALTEQVEARLAAIGYTPVRLGGTDRYSTAAAIAGAVPGAASILVATGLDFPDALAAGAAAAEVGGVVVLTAGAVMPAPTAEFLAARPGWDRYAVGGPAAAADPGATPLVGASRYDTAVRVAEQFFSAPVVVGLATGTDFPDALAGGGHIGRRRAPMLLTSPIRVPAAVWSYLDANRATIEGAFVYGGVGAISAAVEATIIALIE